MNASSALVALLPFPIWLRNGGLQHSPRPGRRSGRPSRRSPLSMCTDDAQSVAAAGDLSLSLSFAAEMECDSQSLQTSQAQGLRTLLAWGHYIYLQDEAKSGIKFHEGKTWLFIIVHLP